ncbi:hypothetical protein EB231_32125 [Mesorhizobium sp. NZP2298]|nr:hypothetical protein EB231_32125 [Mesorhizobium sp. NZP2298]
MISAGSTPSWDRKAGEWLAKSVPPQTGVDHQNLAELPGGLSGIAAADDNWRSEIRKIASDRLRTPIRLPIRLMHWRAIF